MLTNVHGLLACSDGGHPGCLWDLDCAVQEIAEIEQMFVSYLLAKDTREFGILTRSRKISLAIMGHNGPVWMLPGIVNLDE
jgi:hypothetical protein